MLDAGKTITHVFRRYDPDTRQNVLVSEMLTGSWFREEKTGVSDQTVTVTDIVKVRIPVKKGNDIPAITTGDLMILGAVNISDLSIGDIRKRFPESFQVQSVTLNLQSLTGYSDHIRCSGS